MADPDVIEAYLQAIHEVLDEVTQKTLAASDLEARYHEVYHRLVLAAAWQESCWRQFIRASGAVTYLKSPVGSTGMMQVNEHVWRGLYDLRGLRWDIHYNGRAGSEILLHYLQELRDCQERRRAARRRRQPRPRYLRRLQRRPRPPDTLPQTRHEAVTPPHRRTVRGKVPSGQCRQGSGGEPVYRGTVRSNRNQ